VTTRLYFALCIGLPIAVCLVGLLSDYESFLPIVLCGAVVYLPIAMWAWWRVHLATSFDTFWNIGIYFPVTSGLLLSGLFAFPQVLGGGGGSGLLAVVAFICALVTGYGYVLLVWLTYRALRKVGILSNEFAA